MRHAQPHRPRHSARASLLNRRDSPTFELLEDRHLLFAPYTHVEVGIDARDDAIDGQVTIDGNDYDVNPTLLAAISNPSNFPFYNAGLAGSSAFPDVSFGRDVVRDGNSGEWLSHVYEQAWQAQDSTEYTATQKEQILAWSYGYLSSSIGDVWSAGIVNEIAGGPFPQLGELDGNVPNQEVALRHFFIENYIADATPGFDGNPDRALVPTTGDTSDDSTPGVPMDAPHNFIYETFLESNAGQPDAGRGIFVQHFLDLRARLEELAADPVLGSDADVVGEVANVNSVEDAIDDVNAECATSLGLPINVTSTTCQTALQALGIEGYEYVTSDVLDLADEQAESLKRELLRAYIRRWIADIDEGLVAWSELSLSITQALYDPETRRDIQNTKCGGLGTEVGVARVNCEDGVGVVEVIKKKSDDYVNDHLLRMLGSPHFVGGLNSALTKFVGIIGNAVRSTTGLHPLLNGVASLKNGAEAMITRAVNAVVGFDLDAFGEFVKSPSSKLGVDEVTIDGTTLQIFDVGDRATLDGYLGLTAGDHEPLGAIDTFGSLTFHDAIGRLNDAAELNKTTFAAYANSVTMTKLLFLEEFALNDLLQNLSGVATYDANLLHTNSDYSANILSLTLPRVEDADGNAVESTNWIGSINGGNAWRADAQPITADGGGHGNSPLWESCLLRDSFANVFTDWQNGAMQFPDLGDDTSHDPNEFAPEVWYFDAPGYFGGTQTLYVNGSAVHTIQVEDDGVNVEVSWAAVPGLHCAGSESLPVGDVGQVIVNGITSVTTIGTTVTTTSHSGAISGTKFNDANGDAVRDLVEEPGLQHWKISLDTVEDGDTLEPTRYTSAGGTYSFSGLPFDDYTVHEEVVSGWKQSLPIQTVGDNFHSVTLDAGNPAETDVDFGNFRTVNVDWLPALGAFLDETLEIKQNPLEVIGFDRSFDDFVNIPFVDRDIHEIVDFEGLFRQIDLSLYEDATVVADTAPTSFDATDARFLISAGGATPVEFTTTVAGNADLADLVASLNSALSGTDLDGIVEFAVEGANVALQTASPGLMPALTVATLRMVADNNGPAFGQLDPIDGPIDPFTVKVVRTIPDAMGVPTAQPEEEYEFTIGAEPPTGTDSFVHTQDNTSLTDLANDLNDGFTSVGLFDVIALVDGVKLVLAATSPTVTEISIDGMTGDRLGFSNNQDVDTASNANEAQTVLGFNGGQGLADRKYESIQEMLPLVEAAVITISDDAGLPINGGAPYSINAEYDIDKETVEFNLKLNQNFSETVYTGDFENSVDLFGNLTNPMPAQVLGPLEIGANLQADFTIPARLDLDVGIKLGDRATGFKISETSKLSWLNGLNGVNLNVGTVAPNVIPINGVPGQDVDFTLEYIRENGTYSFDFTLSSSPTDDVTSHDNADGDSLASDLNNLLREEFLGDSFRFEIQTTRILDAMGDEIDTEERLILRVVDSGIRGFSLIGDDIDLLGFSAGQQDSDFDDLRFTIGTPGGDTDCTDDNCSVSVSLNGALTVQDVIDRIQAVPGAGSEPAIRVTINDAQDGLRLEANDELIVTAASTPTKLTQSVSGTDVDDKITSLAALSLGILGVANDENVLVGTSLDGATVRDRIYIIERDSISTDKNVSLGVGVDFPTIDASVGFSQVSLELDGDAQFDVNLSTNLRDPGRKFFTGAGGDGKVTLSERFSFPGEVYYLNPLDAGTLQINLFASANLELGLGFDTGGNDFLELITGPLGSLIELTAVADTLNNQFLLDVESQFLETLQNLNNITVEDIVNLIRVFAASLKSDDELAEGNTEVTFVSGGISATEEVGGGIEDAADSINTAIDGPMVKSAIDDVEEAVDNLDLPAEQRVQMKGAISTLRAASADTNLADANGNSRMPARLIAASRKLSKAIDAEVESLGSPLAGKTELIEAKDNLFSLVPALNAIEQIISDAIEQKLEDVLNFNPANFDFDLGIANDINGAGDDALLIGLSLHDDDLLSKDFSPEMPVSDDFGPLEFEIEPGPVELHVGGAIGIGLAFNFQDKQPLVVVEPPAVLGDPAVFDGIPVHKTELDLNVGFVSQIDAEASFGNLDLIDVEADLSLLKSEIDKFGPVDFSDHDVELSGVPFEGTDGRFLVVAVSETMVDGSIDSEVLTAESDYTVTESAGVYTVSIDPGYVFGAADRVTVEYHTTDPSAVDPAVVANRAAFKLDFEPKSPITDNDIGAVPLLDLFSDTHTRIDAQADDMTGEPTQGSLLIGSVDASLLNSNANDVIAVATSMQHILQPQVYFDSEAIGELIEGVDFNLKTILLGIEAFLETLEEGLKSDVLDKLPVISADDLDMASTFIGQLRTEFLEPFIDVLCDAGGDLAAVELVIEQFIVDKLGPSGIGILADRNAPATIGLEDVEVTITQDNFDVAFTIGGSDKMVVDFDTGLDGLKIDASGSGGVELGWDYSIDFGVGVDRDGFYFLVNDEGDEAAPANPEIELNIGAGLIVDNSGPEPIPTSIGVNLFGLNLTATDNNDGPNPGTFIGGMLTLDINDVGANDNKLEIADFGNTSFGDIFDASLNIPVQLDIHLDAGINSNLPSVEADLKLDWGVEIAHEAGMGGLIVTTQDLNFSVEDLGINLGDFLSKHVGRALDAIDNYIEPLKPIIKVFKTEIPGLSEASEAAGKGPVTFLDVAFIKEPEKGKQAKKFVDAIDTILSLIDSLKTVDDSDKVSFILLDELNIIDSAMTGGTDGGLTDPNFSEMTDAGEKAEMATPNEKTGLKNKIKNLLQKVEDLGINLHILEPKTLVNMILGRPFDIISYELPRFELPFSWEISFGIFPTPPIVLRVGIDFDIFADLSVGYDSRGIDTGNFFDGFYFGDLQDVISGPDIEEFGLGLGARLAALLDIGVASAGVEGEIRADVFANWRDSDDNGKLYLDEIVDIVKSDGFECLFDLRGELRAIVRLVWEVLGIDGDYELINKVLLEFQNECPKYELGHVVEGTVGTITPGPSAVSAPGTLVIHAGPFASERRSGSTSDVAEDVVVTQTAPGVFKVEMLGLMKSYSGVEHIFFDGGNHNDSITLVGVEVAVTAIGGAGDDSIVGTRYADYLDGGAGVDNIRGRGDGDTIFGGTGDDTIYADLGPGESSGTWGSDGDDTVDAGSGDDFVIAAGGADFVDGGSGHDEIYGHIDASGSVSADADAADELHGGIGNDVIYGNEGDDNLFGDGGSDELYGEAGSDSIQGGPGKDLLLGDTGNDTLEGGSGPDIIAGGIGSDVLKGDDGADLIVGGVLTGNADQQAIFETLWGAGPAFVSMIVAMETAGVDTDDQLTGGRDGDLLIGDAGGDQLLGGYGDDAIIAHLILDPTSTDVEYIEGGPNNDFICGANGQDEIYGGTSLVGLADVLSDAAGPSLGGGFTMTSCDALPEIIPTPNPASISGVKFNDQNEDGVRDPSEPGLEGWTIHVLDSAGEIVDSQTTNSDGEYTISSLDPGSYRVVEEAQDHWTQTTPGGLNLRDMAIDPVSGNAFAISANSLYSIDLGTNEATLVATLGISPQSAMTFASDGTLYTMGFGDPNLYAINLITGFATTVANTGHLSDGGIAFSPADNHVYLSNGSTLVKVDPVAGTTTVVGPHGVTGMIAIRANEFGQIFGLDVNLNYYGINATDGSVVPAGVGDTFETLGLAGLSVDTLSVVEDPSDDGYEFSILSGQSATDIDFGNRFQGGEIRGRKYNDINGDGVRQVSEPYLNGWNIEVYDEAGSLVGSATTADLDLDGNGVIDDETEKGWYVVGDLTPGEFSVTELAVPDWVQTQPHLSASNAFQPIADDGYQQTRSDLFVAGLIGTVTNATLTLNVQHPNVQELKAFLLSPDGTRIDLFDGVGADGDEFASTTFSDAGISEISDGLAPFIGSYQPTDPLALLNGENPNGLWTLVIEDTIEGTTGRLNDWSLTLATTGSGTTTSSAGDSNPHVSSRVHHIDVTVGADETIGDVDFGNYRIASIEGFKFADVNGNALRDADEPGLAGVTIFADLNNNGTLDRGEPSTQTVEDSPSTNENELGTFTLSPLAPGSYSIREVIPDNYMQTFPVTTLAGTLGAHNLSLSSGELISGPDEQVVFGNQPKGSIHGTKWLDKNRNGVRDPEEPGVPRVTVFADINGNGEFDVDEPSAVTMFDDPATEFDEAGMYWLEDLPMGTYDVHEVVPDGMVQTSGGEATIYSNDFEPEPPNLAGWTPPSVSFAAGVGTQFLGPFGNDDVLLQVNSLPAHDTLNIEFDLYVLGEWDGYGTPELGTPDRWLMNLLGESATVDTTFSKTDSTLQAYPGTFTLDFHAPQTGAVSIGAIDYTNAAGQMLQGDIYRVTASVAHSASTLQLQFRGDGLADIPGDSPELWGIDNLLITAPVSYHEVVIDSPGAVEGFDFGNVPSGHSSIHGQKWNDENGDGKRQEREFGIDGWTIELLDANGNVVATQTTMSMDVNGDGEIDPFRESGLYWFDQLPGGRYTVTESERPGWTQTFPATSPEFMPGDSNFDYEFNSSDFIVVFIAAKYETGEAATFAEGDWNGDGVFDSSDFVAVFTIGHYEKGPYASPDQQDHIVELRERMTLERLDFGNHKVPNNGKAAEIRGRKWNDLNGDGWRDENEGPIAGVTVYVDANFNNQFDPGEANTSTSEDGRYSLIVEPGEIVLREVVPAGMRQTYPINGAHTLNLSDGQIITGIQFGNTRDQQIPPVPGAARAAQANDQSAIHGTKWEDLDGDGVFDVNEPTLNGVTIYLDLNNNRIHDQFVDSVGNLIDEPSTQTGPNGQYAFTNLSSGEYWVREIVPIGYRQTFPGPDLFGHFLGLQPGQTVDGRDFGNQPRLGSVHGRKWLDLDGSGKRDTNEPGLAGVTVYADLNLNGMLDPNEPSTITMGDDPATRQDETGMFWLDAVPTGRVIHVREVVPNGMVQTFPRNPDFHTVRFGDELIVEGLLFGNRREQTRPHGSIHGTKWLDERPNGKWEPETEPGIAGVTIFLDLNGNGVLDPNEPSTVTMEDDPLTPQNELGMYWLDDVPAGTHLVAEVVPFGFEQTYPIDGQPHEITTDGQKVDGVNFGNRPSQGGEIHGTKWLDNQDPLGVRNEDEPGIAGVTIYLDLNKNHVLDDDEPTTVTVDDDPLTPEDETGQYWFTSVPAGIYEVREVVPAGYLQSFPFNDLSVAPLPFIGLTRSPLDNRLYSVTVSGAIHRFEIDSPISEIIGTLPFTLGEGDVEFDPTNGILYAHDSGPSSSLHRIDLGTDPISGDPIVISHSTVGVIPGAVDPSAMVIDSLGDMFVVDLDPAGPQILEINKYDASVISAAPITGLGSPTPSLAGMTYDASRGVFLLATATNVYSIDLSGLVTSFAAIGVSNLAGIATLDNRHHDVAANGRVIEGVDFGNFEPIYLPDGDDIVYAQDDTDIVYGDNVVEDPRIISTGSRSDTLFGDGGSDLLFGQEETDQLSGGSDDGTPANDLLDGGLGTDRVYQAADNDQTLTNTQLVGEGTDQLVSIERGTLVGGAGDNTLDASAFTVGPVELFGLGGDDDLIGTMFGDLLDGGMDSDTLRGGDGDDTYQFGDVNILVPTETDTIEEPLATGGTDTLDFSAAPHGVVVDLNSATVAAHPIVLPQRIVNVAGPGQEQNLEDVVGSVFDDVVDGNAADNTILTGLGNDNVVDAGPGNDTINLGGGTGESASGGTGNDTYLFDAGWGDALIAEFAASGNDTLDLSAVFEETTFEIDGSPTATDGTNTVTFSQNVDNLLSGNKADRFEFTDGFMLPTGGSIASAGGIDLLDFDAYTSSINVDLNAGSALAGGSTISLSGIENVIGGAAADTIIGDDNANSLIGGAGIDTISGLGGNDQIQGGQHADVINGGADNDTIHGEAGDDNISGGSGDDTFVYVDGDGFDTVSEGVLGGNDRLDLSAVTNALTVNVDAIVDIDFTSGGDVIDASNQIEMILLGSADDTVEFANGAGLTGEVDGGMGINRLDYSAYLSGITVDLSTNSATGATSAFGFTNVTGGAANDTITGDDSDNRLDGQAGDDTIHGGKGADYLVGGPATVEDNLFGGPGDDTYWIQNNATRDVLHETGGTVSGGLLSNGGNDTVELRTVVGNTTLSLQLGIVQTVSVGGPQVQLNAPENFENVSGSLFATNTLVGNAADNILRGGASGDMLTGMDGDDILIGFGGNDTANGDGGNDIVVGGSDNDMSLNGGAGRDIIVGGLGSDVIDGGDDDDIVVDGTTNYDSPLDISAFETLRLEWISTLKSYTTRMNNLATGVGPAPSPSNISLFVGIGGTVTHDADLDMIVGGLGNDLFFEAAPDVSDQTPPEALFAVPGAPVPAMSVLDTAERNAIFANFASDVDDFNNGKRTTNDEWDAALLEELDDDFPAFLP